LQTQSYDNTISLVIQIGHPIAPRLFGNNAANGNPQHLGWSTRVNGSNWDQAQGASTGNNGEFYHYGYTLSMDYPFANGSVQHPGGHKGFILKFDKDQVLDRSLFFGDTNGTEITGLVELSNGDVYFGGGSSGIKLPGNTNNNPGTSSGFGVNYSSNLTRLASTNLVYFGNWNSSSLADIALKANGNAVVVGTTQSTDSLVGIPFVNPGGGAYYKNTLSGKDEGFIAEITPGATAPVWCTAFGSDSTDEMMSVSTLENKVFVGMDTRSDDSFNSCVYNANNKLPLCNPSSGYSHGFHTNSYNDHFLACFDENRQLEHSTYLGGNNSEVDIDVVALSTGGVAVLGSTYDLTGFVLSSNPQGYSWTGSSAASFGYLLQFSADYTLDWHTIIGCNGATKFTRGQSIVESGDGSIYVFAATDCDNAVAPIDYCTPPASGSEYPQCDNNNKWWLQESLGNAVNYGGLDGAVLGFNTARDMIWSTWYGGTGVEQNVNIAYDADGEQIFINGSSKSAGNFPLQKLTNPSSYFSPTPDTTVMGGFAAKFSVNQSTEDTNGPVDVGKQVLENIFVYPNPVQSQLHFSDNVLGVSFKVFDVFGRTVREGELIENGLSVIELSTGVYFIEVDAVQGHAKQTIKFVKE